MVAENNADPNNVDRSEEDRQLQRDILSGRQFSLADAIGREGGSFMKGASPVPRTVQVKTEINSFIDVHLPDRPGALQATLQDWVNADETFTSRHQSAPLRALLEMVQKILESRSLFYEFVRQVDVKWGQLYDEPPHFEVAGRPPHPEDEYTRASVAGQLSEFVNVIRDRL